MTEDEVLAYVRAAARMLDLPLDTQRAQAVALHLDHTAHIARLLEDAPLGVEDEPAQLYCLAPFPPEDAP